MQPWAEVAEGEVGQKEVPGSSDNSRILHYFDSTNYPKAGLHDEVPYCAAGLNWCLEKVGIKGTGSAAAKSFLGWGVELEEPIEDCICIIQQKVTGKDQATGSMSGFHVGIWKKQDSEYVTLLGFNQSDQVKYSNFKLSSYTVRGYRWPLKMES